ncbi:hypothetical protein EFR01_50310 [Sinorhizobium fredii]|nr:hypothetical protein EFR01_50310 [Sinorhizobium fredii]GLS08668.1 hypothetical protein GCM10007864_22970 [Sinorhizobium fredii]
MTQEAAAKVITHLLRRVAKCPVVSGRCQSCVREASRLASKGCPSTWQPNVRRENGDRTWRKAD